MSSAFAVELFALSALDSFADRLSRLQLHGLSLQNPWTGLVTQLDVVGNQFQSTPASIVSRANSREEVRFQLWLDGDHDVYCRVRTTRGYSLIDYGLDGLDRDRLAIASSALWCSLWPSLRGLQGFVLDRSGRTEDVDWAAVLIGDGQIPAAPDLLIRRVSSAPEGVFDVTVR